MMFLVDDFCHDGSDDSDDDNMLRHHLLVRQLRPFGAEFARRIGSAFPPKKKCSEVLTS